MSDLLLIEWPVCRWDLFVQNKFDSIEIIDDQFINRWSHQYSIDYCLNSMNEYDFIQDSSKRAVLYLFLSKYANHLNFVFPCYFLGRRSSDNVLFCVNERQHDHDHEFNVLQFFQMLHFLKTTCSFIYGSKHLQMQNNKLTNFTYTSFFLNYDYVGNSKEETIDFFLELVHDVETINYYKTLKSLRNHLNVLQSNSYEDELILLKFIETRQKHELQHIQSKYNNFIIYDEDVELFDQLVQICRNTSSIQN